MNLIGRKNHVLRPERTNPTGEIKILQLARNRALILGIGENGPHRATLGARTKETPGLPKNSTPAQEPSQKLRVASILLALPGDGGRTRHTQMIEAVPTADHAINLDESSSHIARGEDVAPWGEKDIEQYGQSEK